MLLGKTPNRNPPNCFVKARWHLQVTQTFSGGCLKDIVQNLTVEMDLEMVLGILNDVAVAMAYIYHLAPSIPHQPLSSGRVWDKVIIVPDLASFLACLCMHSASCQAAHVFVCYNSKELPVEPCLLSMQQDKWSLMASELQVQHTQGQ